MVPVAIFDPGAVCVQPPSVLKIPGVPNPGGTDSVTVKEPGPNVTS